MRADELDKQFLRKAVLLCASCKTNVSAEDRFRKSAQRRRGALPFAHSVAPRIGNSKANIPAKDNFAIPSPISLAPSLS